MITPLSATEEMLMHVARLRAVVSAVEDVTIPRHDTGDE
jgi:hypothetical protein